MEQISPQKLLKRLQSPQKIMFLIDSLNHSKIKIAKKVYNLQTRNIKKFIKQQRQIQQKQRAQDSKMKKKIDCSKKYDQNQSLQLQYRLKQKQLQPVLIDRCRTQTSQINNISRKTGNRTKLVNKFRTFNDLPNVQSTSIQKNRSKRVTYIQEFSLKKNRHESFGNLPRIILRKKSRSIYQDPNKIKSYIQIRQLPEWSEKLGTPRINIQKSSQAMKNSSSSIMRFQGKSFLRIKLSPSSKIQKLVQLTDDKMSRYIKYLQNLVYGSYEYGRPLNQQKVNEMILERYSVKNNSNISNINEKKCFRLPYMEFISQSEIRKSIHRIINMSVKNTQNVVFRLLDFNKNGIIDQNDLINLIQLSQKLPQVKEDFLRIARYACKQDNSWISNVKSISERQDPHRRAEKIVDDPSAYQSLESCKSIQKGLKTKNISKTKQKERSLTYSTSQGSQLVSIGKMEKYNNNNNSPLFNKERLYTFLETKTNSLTFKDNKQSFKLRVTLSDFHNVFGSERPGIFCDLLAFLFGVRKEDTIEKDVSFTQHSNKKSQMLSMPRYQNSGFKNYNIPQIVKDFQVKFASNIQQTKYQHIQIL